VKNGNFGDLVTILFQVLQVSDHLVDLPVVTYIQYRLVVNSPGQQPLTWKVGEKKHPNDSNDFFHRSSFVQVSLWECVIEDSSCESNHSPRSAPLSCRENALSEVFNTQFRRIQFLHKGNDPSCDH
jgi:hypothetical protein